MFVIYDEWRPNVPSIFPQKPKFDRTQPDWHEETRKIFDFETFPFEGVDQAKIFTKSVEVKKGLPDEIIKLGNDIKIQYQDLLVQRYNI